MHTLRKTALALLLIFAGVHARAIDPAPTAAQLRQLMADEPLVSAGKHAGIDYAGALERAIAKDSAGMITLFRFTTSEWHDGAVGESHDLIITGLLQRWGDRDFARVLRPQPRRVRKAVINAIEPWFPDQRWPTQYPLTYSLAPH